MFLFVSFYRLHFIVAAAANVIFWKKNLSLSPLMPSTD